MLTIREKVKDIKDKSGTVTGHEKYTYLDLNRKQYDKMIQCSVAVSAYKRCKRDWGMYGVRIIGEINYLEIIAWAVSDEIEPVPADNYVKYEPLQISKELKEELGV